MRMAEEARPARGDRLLCLFSRKNDPFMDSLLPEKKSMKRPRHFMLNLGKKFSM